MKKLFYISVLFLSSIGTLGQHAGHIGQYMTNGLPLNPAFSGTREATSIALSYRNQWGGLEGAPVTQILTAHSPLKNDEFAVGFMAYNDRIGVSSKMGSQISLAYRMKMPQGKLSMALSGGIQQANNRWGEVVTTDAEDVVFSSGSERFTLPDFGAGIYFYNDKYYVSVSVPSILSPQYSGGAEYSGVSTLIDLDIYLNGGCKIDLTEEWQLRPSAMIRHSQGSPSQLDLNGIANYKNILETGVSWRSGDAVMCMLKVWTNPQFNVAYSYEYTISDLSTYSNGTHEVTLQYDFKYKTGATNPRFF